MEGGQRAGAEERALNFIFSRAESEIFLQSVKQKQRAQRPDSAAVLSIRAAASRVGRVSH